MSEVIVEILHDRKELVARASSDVAALLLERLSNQDEVHLAITGGTVGTEVLAELSGKTKDMNLDKLHIWWIDERYVESSSRERNELQAREAWLDGSKIPSGNIHAFPASGVGSIEEAADAFSKIIEDIQPAFDLVLLGIRKRVNLDSALPGFAHGRDCRCNGH